MNEDLVEKPYEIQNDFDTGVQKLTQRFCPKELSVCTILDYFRASFSNCQTGRV